MVQYYVKILVYSFVFSVICEGLSDGVFIVYPFKENDIIQSKSKLRKFEGTVGRSPKMLNETNLHLVYATYGDNTITTPAPIPTLKYDEPLLDTTTMMERYTEIFSDFITTENIDSYTQSKDVALDSTKEIKDETTTVGTIDSTTVDLMTTETDLLIQNLPDPEQSLVDNIYEETGPKKTLRKRMFEVIKSSRKYPTGLKMNKGMKKPTTTSPRDLFKNWYRKTIRHKGMHSKYRFKNVNKLSPKISSKDL